MKIGTILLNTCVRENHPFRYSIYTGQSNGKAGFIYPYENSINNGYYYISDVGKDNVIQPIGYINLPSILRQAIDDNVNRYTEFSRERGNN